MVVCLLASCSDSDAELADKYGAYITSANSYVSQGQFQAALIEASNAIQLAANNQEGYQVMTEIYLKLGQPREAVNLLGQIENPDETTLLLLAEANLEVGKLRSARQVLARLSAPDADQAVRLAARLELSEGNYAEAKQLYGQLLAKDPMDAAANLGLARLHLAMDEPAEAKALLEKISSEGSLRPESLYLLASVASRQNDLDSAENFLNEAISSLPSTDIITPLRFSILSAMQNNLTAQGKTEEAMIYSGLLAEALPGAQQTGKLLESAVAAIQSGDLDAARSTLAEARELAPTSPRAATLLATVDFLEGNNEAAALQLEQFIDPETSSATELQIYAVSQLRLGNADKVVSRLGADIEGTDNAKLMALYAMALGEVGEFEKAEAHFQKAIALNPADGRLHLPIAQIRMRNGDDESALEELQSALSKSPDDVVVQRQLIGLYIKMGMIDKADSFVRGIDASYPNSLDSQLIVAAYHLRSGDVKAAEDKFKAALKLGESPFARNELARIYMEARNYQAAEAQYRKVIELTPENPDAYKGFITALELTERKDQVVAELNTMIEASNSNTAILVLSEYLGRNGRLQEARDAFAQYEGDYTPDASRLSESLTLAASRDLIAKNKIAEARSQLQKAIEASPESERLIAALITLNIKDQKYGEAAMGIEQLSLISTRPIVGILRGDLSSAQSDFAAARDAYLEVWQMAAGDQLGFKVFRAMESAKSDESEIVEFLNDWIEQSENPALALMTRAGYFLAADKLERARADYLAVVESDPDNIAALNNLAWAYGDANPADALSASERAYALASNNPQILDTYGWFLYKSGKLAEARDTLQRAIELAPEDLEIRAHYEEVTANP